MFVLLNPSTADAGKDDPTLRRCVDYAKRWGFGSSYTVNLFAYRATDPATLVSAPKPVGPRNNYWIRRMAVYTDLAVAGWGNGGGLYGRDQEIRRMIPNLHCIKVNGSGHPAHPLYLRKEMKPTKLNDTDDAMPAHVADVFNGYDENQKVLLLELRKLIFNVAQQDQLIGALSEALKWGQPSYLTATSGSGTTVRIGPSSKKPGWCGLYVHCQTNLVSTWRTMFADTFEFDGNRGILLAPGQDLDKEAIAFCVSMALRYHLEEQS